MLQILSIEIPLSSDDFNLPDAVLSAIQQAPPDLHQGDVIALPAPLVSISQQRFKRLTGITPSAEAQRLSTQYQIPLALAELMLVEAEFIIGQDSAGDMITARQGTIFKNAGLEVDAADPDTILLPPQEPHQVAEAIRQAVEGTMAIRVGVMIVGDALVIGRKGTGGIALGTAGFKAVQSYHGVADLLGNPLKYTSRSWADQLAGAAKLRFRTRQTLVIIKNSGVAMQDAIFSFEQMSISRQQDIYWGLRPVRYE